MKRGIMFSAACGALLLASGCAGTPTPAVTVTVTATPPPAATVPPDTTNSVLVPDVTGLTGDMAYAAVTTAGFGVVWAVDDPTDWSESDVIIDSQEPPGGAWVEAGSKVTLFGTVQGRGDIIEDEPEEGRGDIID